MKLFGRRRKLTTPDGLQAVALPTNYTQYLNLYGLRGSYGYLYRSQPNVRSVIDFISTEAASVNIKHYEKVLAGPRAPAGRLELKDSELQRVLDRPSPTVTRTRLWFATVADMHIYDVAYWQKVRQDGRVRALVRVPPSALSPNRDAVNKRIVSYSTTIGTTISLDDLVVFEGYDPELQQGSVSPLETLRRVLAEEYAAGRNREYTWRNAARKSGVVERPVDAPQWGQEQRQAWRLEWEGIMSGDTNSGRVGLLEDGMHWVEGAWSPKEMEYLEARKLTRLECAAAFRVDPRLVFATTDPANKEVRTGFYTDRLVPLLTRLQEEVDLQLLPDFEAFDSKRTQYTEFNIEEKLRGSFIEEAQIASSAVGGPFVTVNEMRARRNLPPVPDGDEVFIPLNSARGGGPQASPRAPVETPGPNPAPGETPGGGTASYSPIVNVYTNGHKAAETAPEDVLPSAPARALQRRQDTADRYEQALLKHFRRQRNSVKSLGASIKRNAGVKIALDTERWDRELAADLRELSEGVVDENAERAIRQIAKGKARKAYEPDRTRAYIRKVTEIQAQRINAKTMEDVDAALAEEDPEEALEHTFTETAQGRAATVGLSMATAFINFGRNEGASQGGGRTKTWIVTSAKSRHPGLNGETTSVGVPFSNGLMWPGEASGDVDEVAGCMCLLDLS